jgi:hypothetical protein
MTAQTDGCWWPLADQSSRSPGGNQADGLRPLPAASRSSTRTRRPLAPSPQVHSKWSRGLPVRTPADGQPPLAGGGAVVRRQVLAGDEVRAVARGERLDVVEEVHRLVVLHAAAARHLGAVLLQRLNHVVEQRHAAHGVGRAPGLWHLRCQTDRQTDGRWVQPVHLLRSQRGSCNR